MRVLITGGAGFVGSRLAAHALEQGSSVVVLDDLSSSYRESVPEGAELVVGKADDQKVVGDRGPFDAVYHLAAYAAECMSPFVRRHVYQNNVAQSAGLVSNLIDVEFSGRLVFASSVAAYGSGLPSPFDERMHCWPSDPYGVSKFATEMDLRIAGEQHGLDWCALRLYNVYGPGQSLWQPHRNVLGIWARQALEGKKITVFGDGEQLRAFTFIDDVLPALWRAGRCDCDAASQEVINLGARAALSLNDLLEAFSAVTGYANWGRLPARHEARSAWCSTTKARTLLGPWRETTLESGIERYWAWAQRAWAEHPERRNVETFPRLDDVETFVGMPESWKEELIGAQSSSG